MKTPYNILVNAETKNKRHKINVSNIALEICTSLANWRLTESQTTTDDVQCMQQLRQHCRRAFSNQKQPQEIDQSNDPERT